jgi:hypothetical protein
LKTALYPRTPQKCQSTNRWSLKQILHPNAAKETPIYPMQFEQWKIHPMPLKTNPPDAIQTRKCAFPMPLMKSRLKHLQCYARPV